ncbi:hypothetical protein L288_00465 [Sphingobium quisquiliarum P25]|uniref:Uncharacterized protein n=1 Tax=Sphingobium quisquiliarum P25 TaxID=1329909 RepID=T0HF88_9SPHN|nr:hypothetical protein [Sphingobium quisquiliarum]EQB15036.1 hypothetical protein L288_00465 [Sphingobium quisquiliarum P25]
MKKKSGRPPRSLSAWRALQAQGELEARFPEVAMLIDTLAGNVDPDHVKIALSGAIKSVKAARSRSHEELPTNASIEQRQLHAAAEVERIAQDCCVLKKLAAAVMAELDSATADLAHAETLLTSIMLKGGSVDGYERTIANKLRAAGLTERLARESNAGHVLRIKEALDGAPVADTAQAHPMRQKAEVALAWTANNPWIAVLAKAEHYRFDRRPMTSGAVDVTALLQCGLPPHTDLAMFGDPHLVGCFEAAPDALTTARTCWEVCAKWVYDNIVDDLSSSGVANLRRRAWTLLFGVQYDFAHEIEELHRVNLPSPWKPNEYVVAQLRD